MDRSELPYDAMGDYSSQEQNPVTKTDLSRFHKAQLKRAQRNLEAAVQRGDHRAVANIKRKIQIHQYTVRLVEE